jgi:hypothetical protein
MFGGAGGSCPLIEIPGPGGQSFSINPNTWIGTIRTMIALLMWWGVFVGSNFLFWKIGFS